MQRISSLAACRELGGLAACSPGLCCVWKKGPTCSRQRWAGACVRPARPLSGEAGAQGRRLSRRRLVFAGQEHRPFSSQPGAEGPQESPSAHPGVTVVGIPDPITWFRCRFYMYLVKLLFGLDVKSVEFQNGVKQALVHVSEMLSSSSYHRLVGLVSREMIDYVEEKGRALSRAQRKQLAVTMDNIIFMLPEDVSIVFDDYGRKFCFVVMRFWILSTLEGPDDPEATKIFKVASSDDGGPQKKVVTAVYEFRRELSTRVSTDWVVTTIWHWHWKAAE